LDLADKAVSSVNEFGLAAKQLCKGSGVQEVIF